MGVITYNVLISLPWSRPQRQYLFQKNLKW